MSLVSRKEYIESRRRELRFMVDTLYDVYSDKSKLDKSIKRHAVLGDGMSGLKKNPDKAVDVLLPIIRSYGEKDWVFSKAVDALLKEGVDRFYGEWLDIKVN